MLILSHETSVRVDSTRPSIDMKRGMLRMGGVDPDGMDELGRQRYAPSDLLHLLSVAPSNVEPSRHPCSCPPRSRVPFMTSRVEKPIQVCSLLPISGTPLSSPTSPSSV